MSSWGSTSSSSSNTTLLTRQAIRIPAMRVHGCQGTWSANPYLQALAKEVCG